MRIAALIIHLHTQAAGVITETSKLRVNAIKRIHFKAELPSDVLLLQRVPSDKKQKAGKSDLLAKVCEYYWASARRLFRE